ncbi:MAG: DUF935 domain-containing protein [Pseudomonadota bacterium]
MAQLLDQFGNPVRRRDLKAELARPGLTGIRQAWQPSVAAGLTPAKLAAVLTAAAEGEGYDYLTLAEEIEERDNHYFSVLGTRKHAVSGIEPIVKSASDDARDKAIADAVRERIAEHDGFAALVEDLMDGLGKGYSAVEIMWKTEAAEWRPVKFVHRDPRFFRVDRETLSELRLLTDEAPAEGIVPPPFKFMIHQPRLKAGLPLRGGLARFVAFTWICKAYAVKDWAAFAEVFGLPIRIGKYDASATKKDVEVLHQAVAMIGSDAAAVIPESMRIEFEEVGDGTGNDIFERLSNWADKQISKAVLGQTMTSDDGSSHAQAGVHNEVRMDIQAADAVQVSGTIQRDLVIPFVDLNFGPQDHYPTLALKVEEAEDIDSLVVQVERLAGLGVTFSATELREKLNLKAPEDQDDTVGLSAEELLQRRGLGEPSTNRARRNAAAAHADPYDAADAIADEALDDWLEMTEGVLGPVEELLRDAGSFEEALLRLPELVGRMAAQELIDQLVQAAAKARAEGEIA